MDPPPHEAGLEVDDVAVAEAEDVAGAGEGARGRGRRGGRAGEEGGGGGGGGGRGGGGRGLFSSLPFFFFSCVPPASRPCWCR
ncbi:MAG: hypothetical protein OXF01_07180, partial [Gemmatimonadetes bacterium]|nr:hypothetical protein [Gemmatimonadota bacterium]